MWFPNRFDTNRAVQAHKMTSDWKFWIYKVEEIYFPYNESKGAEQLRSDCEADLRLFFANADCWFSHGAAHILEYGYLYIHTAAERNKDTAQLRSASLLSPHG